MCSSDLLRRAQLPEAGDVLAVRGGQRFTIQIGYDLGLVGAVLRQLAAGAHPAPRVHVNAPQRERVARRFGAVERRAVVERHDGATSRLPGDRFDLATYP